MLGVGPYTGVLEARSSLVLSCVGLDHLGNQMLLVPSLVQIWIHTMTPTSWTRLRLVLEVLLHKASTYLLKRPVMVVDTEVMTSI